MIAVIGGSGFIGSRLCHLLQETNIKFKIIDKNPSPFFNEYCQIGDVRDFEKLKEALNGSDCVINLAAEHKDNVRPISLYDEVNVDGAKNVCTACEQLDIKNIIFTSSVAVYGFAPLGTDETGEINYFNDYGRTKWNAENVYREWYDKRPNYRALTIVRPTVVFGERNRGNVYNLLKQLSSGFFPMIGNGENMKSMAYVENVAAFLKYCAEKGQGYSLYNYIDKPDFSMNQLVVHVKEALDKKPVVGFHWPKWLGYLGGFVFDFLSFFSGKEFPVSSIRIKKFCSNTVFKAEAIKETSFTSPVSIEEGLKRTVQYEFVEKNDNGILFYSE